MRGGGGRRQNPRCPECGINLQALLRVFSSSFFYFRTNNDTCGRGKKGQFFSFYRDNDKIDSVSLSLSAKPHVRSTNSRGA